MRSRDPNFSRAFVYQSPRGISVVYSRADPAEVLASLKPLFAASSALEHMNLKVKTGALLRQAVVTTVFLNFNCIIEKDLKLELA
jgi:hypothetical protein